MNKITKNWKQTKALFKGRKTCQRSSKAGASAVKFQTFRTEYYVSKSEKKRFKQLKKFELAKIILFIYQKCLRI